MMAANNFRSTGVSSDTPNLDSGAFGLEAAIIDDITPTRAMSSIMADQKRPQVPQKKANLDEVFRLRKELNDLREEKEQAEDMAEMMGQDLFLAEEKMVAKDNELRRYEAKLLECEKQLKAWREKAQGLASEVQEANRTVAEANQANSMRAMAVTSNAAYSLEREQELSQIRERVDDLTASLAREELGKGQARSLHEKELTQLRKQVGQLTASLTERDAERDAERHADALLNGEELVKLQEQTAQLKATLDEKDAELTGKIALAAGKAYDKWQAVLKEKQLEFETRLKENEERTLAELSQQQELRRDAEETLRDLSQQLDTSTNQDQELRHAAEAFLRDVQAKLETASSQLGHEQKLRGAAEALLPSIRSELESTSTQLSREQELRRAADANLLDIASRSETSSTQLTQEQRLRHAAEAALQSTKAQHEAHFREADSRAAAHVAELQQYAQTANQEQALRRQAESFLQNTQAHLEGKLRDADAQVATLQKRVQEAEAASQEQANRMEVQVEQEQLLQRIGSLEAEVAEQKRRCEWFQRNSERLSREIKEVQALKREMEMGGQGVRSRV